ncbi:MAG: phage tail protein [Lachnospiraceae bacterium]|nr:phage tail protein [Lachnospiraceae bacterium]MBR1567558.1 phage tail protein [Lachnospiraceae bacterium]MBR1568714.1 phage tail protein [Lachnospiraceae bacterium]
MYKILVDGNTICDSRVDNLMVIDPVVELEANAAGSFQFTMPAGHPGYDSIHRRKSVIAVYRDDAQDPIFKGICTSETVDFFKQKHIVCEGALTYLNDSIQRPARYQNVTPLALIQTYIANHNAQVDAFKQFEVGTVTVTDPNNSIYCYSNMNPTLQEIKEDLVDDLGGYLRVRYEGGKQYLDYLKESDSRNCNQTIELGKNLLDYSSNIDNTDLATAIIPLGATDENGTVEGLDTRITIASVNGGLDYVYSQAAINTYGKITKVIEWSNITDKNILKRKATQYLAETQFENVVIEAAAVDLGALSDNIDSFELLDRVHVISEPHGMDRWFLITKQTLNLNNPEQDTITLGTNERLSMTAQLASANQTVMKAISQIQPSSSIVQQAVEQATNIINGVEGGYVVFDIDDSTGQPYRILVMDTDDKTTARNVIQINKAGIGFSSNGINGPYRNAWTIQGGLVADFITSGNLNADRIYGGTITSSAFIQRGTVVKYATDYSSTDTDRLRNIMLGKIKPTKEDFEKYDLNGDGRLTSADLVAVNRLVLRTDTQRSISTYLKIEPKGATNLIETDGVIIGINGIRCQAMSSEKVQSDSFEGYNPNSEMYLSGVSGTFSNLSSITVSSGIVTQVITN